MKNDIPIKKTEVANNAMNFEWRYGKDDTNIVLENNKLSVKILRYIVLSSDNKFLFDAISIKESTNNTVIMVRNQKKELGLVWEWRPMPEKWFWACPRGFGDPDDEDNIVTAKREMIEEIGQCKIIDSKKIGVLYQNTTFFENSVGLVLLDVEVIDLQASREEGIVDFKFFTKAEIMTMIRKDKIEDTFTLSAIMKYFASEDLL